MYAVVHVAAVNGHNRFIVAGTTMRVKKIIFANQNFENICAR